MPKLADLIKNISTMSDDELREHVKGIRHRREIIRPAKAKHAEREEKAAGSRTMSKIEKAFAGMSAEERMELLSQLESGDDV